MFFRSLTHFILSVKQILNPLIDIHHPPTPDRQDELTAVTKA